MLKKPMLGLTAAMFLMGSAGLLQAQTTEAPTPGEAPAQTPTQAPAKTPTTDPYRAVDRDFDWGWLGLIGLLGLAGLAGRRRDVVSTTRATNVR
jgi:hypothetical protein